MNGMKIGDKKEVCVWRRWRDGRVNGNVTETRDVIPGRSLGAWDRLAWRRWGACCPSLGWALPLRSGKTKQKS